MNLGSIYKDLGNLDQALASLSNRLAQTENPDALPNQEASTKIEQPWSGSCFHSEILGSNLRQRPHQPGSHLQRSSNLDQALASTLKLLELKPDNPNALTNLGGIYKDLKTLIKLLLPLSNHSSSNLITPTLTNLGGIYKDLQNLDQALASTLKSLELKPDNSSAHTNLGGIYKDRQPWSGSCFHSNHLSSNLITQMPSWTWAASTKN